MTIENRYQRASAIALLGWSVQAPPTPDGQIDVWDRPHAAHQYASGIDWGPEAFGWMRTLVAPERELLVTAELRSLVVAAPERELTVVADPTPRRTGP